MRYEPNTTYPDGPNLIGGNFSNSVAAGKVAQTISGGGIYASCNRNGIFAPCSNKTLADYTTVGGGIGNTADGKASTIPGGWVNYTIGDYATVGGGIGNTASAIYSTVIGGISNTASASAATVAGGARNTATGNNAFIAGGTDNTAAGQWSVASGRRAKAWNDGCFIFGDSSDFDFSCTTNNAFTTRATGGVWFVTAIDGITGAATRTTTIDTNGNFRAAGQVLGNSTTGIAVYGINSSTDAPSVEGWNQGTGELFRGWSGANLSQQLKFRVYGNGNTWIAGTITQASDLRLKTNIQPLDNPLDKVLKLRGVSYSMKDDPTQSRKIGVIAQELEQEYPELVATDDKGMKSVAYANLTPVLIESVKELKVENDTLKADNKALLERLERIEKQLAGLK